MWPQSIAEWPGRLFPFPGTGEVRAEFLLVLPLTSPGGSMSPPNSLSGQRADTVSGDWTLPRPRPLSPDQPITGSAVGGDKGWEECG